MSMQSKIFSTKPRIDGGKDKLQKSSGFRDLVLEEKAGMDMKDVI